MFTYKTTTHYYKNEDYEKTTKDNITTIKIKVAGYNKENYQLYYLENSKFVLININKNEKIFELNINNANYKNTKANIKDGILIIEYEEIEIYDKLHKIKFE